MDDQDPPLEWYLRPNTWARWMPDATVNHTPVFPTASPTPPAMPSDTGEQGFSFKQGDFDWVETPNGGLLAVRKQQMDPSWLHSVMLFGANAGKPTTPALPPPPISPPAAPIGTSDEGGSFLWNQDDFDWVQGANGGLLAVPKQQINPSWVHSAMPFGVKAGLPATPALPSKQPWDDPWPHEAGVTLWDSSTLPIPPALPPIFPSVPRVEHLDSAKYWGTPPSRASAAPTPGSAYYLSRVAEAPSWESVPTHSADRAAQLFPEPLDPSSWETPAPGLSPEKVSPVNEFGAAEDARRIAAERLGRRGRRTAPVPSASSAPDTDADASDPGLSERMRLNALDAYYRGTLVGAGRLALLQHYASTPDEDRISPDDKRVRDDLRKEYRQITADLARYDRMRLFENPAEFGTAALGQLGGAILSPESLIGLGAKGAHALWRLGKAGLQQGAVNLGTDSVVQGLNIKAGVQEQYDPWRTGIASGAGFLAGTAAKSVAELLGRASPLKSAPATAAEQLSANRFAGQAFEQQTGQVFEQRHRLQLSPQITMRTQSGITTRMDFVGRVPQTGEIICIECKGSATARLTHVQRQAFPEIEQGGATVVGAGKPSFPRGTAIPPNRVKIVRPQGSD